jgi:hypothetical protein
MSNNNYESQVSEEKAFEILMEIHNRTMKAAPEPFECVIGDKKFRFTPEDAHIQNKDGEWIPCKLEHEDGKLTAEVNLNEQF